MNLRKFLITVIILANFIHAFSQSENKKTYVTTKTTTAPDIDGSLDDKVWQNSDVAKDFYQVRPYNSRKASFDTEVKILYDDEAIYIGAKMSDSSPDSILTELSPRDDVNNASSFGLYIDPYNDASIAYGFFVTSSGVQIDRKSDNENEYFVGHGDNSWDAVWESEVKIVEDGWIAEFRIPYSALRFPKKDVQEWGLNILRIIRRYKEQDAWNFIDTEISDYNIQAGVLKGIRDIKPPVRLSLIPYLSLSAEKQSEKSKWGHSYKGGMDLQYGINESFTLDMILIPDFGHIESDDIIRSLDPYEVYYEDKRPFFTEGTELFDKGNVFYSRRIGDRPSGYYSVDDSLKANEKIDENPDNTQLINATKVSGKTQKGLGIGFFNAITANTYATAWDTLTGEKRKVLTEPLTNYNMFVLEQSLKNNSYVSLFNTNVLRKGDFPTANVTGTQFRLVENRKTYQLQGNLTINQEYDNENSTSIGSKYYLEAEKISGNFKYSFLYYVETDKYDPNDMGYESRNNESDYRIFFKYDIYEPTWKIIESYNYLGFERSSLYAPRKFEEFEIDLSSFTTFKNYLSVSFDAEVSPVERHDYFEARVANRVFIKPPDYELNLYLSPDYRKRFIVDANVGYFQAITTDEFTYWFSAQPRMRVNDKFNFSIFSEYAKRLNDRGYVTDTAGSVNERVILFGRRQVMNLTNTLHLNYIFNNKSSLSFRLRHYWLWVEYNEFFTLNYDGYLSPSNYHRNHDFTYNAFNIDMVYRWEFAPGSELLLVWKNAIFNEDDKSVKKYLSNMENTLNAPNTNVFTVKVLYYLDSQTMKRKKR